VPYVLVEDFRSGVDDRRSAVAAPPGTLTYLNNGHITRGGEIEKRKAFIPYLDFTGSAPIWGMAGGLLSDYAPASNELWVYGDGAEPAGIPAYVTWVPITDPTGSGRAVRRFRAVDFWGDLPLALVEYEDRTSELFYGTSWIGAAAWDFTDPNRLRDVLILQSKAYGVQKSQLLYSGVGEPTKWNTSDAVGSGLDDMSHEGPDFYDLTTVGTYQNRIATFSRSSCIIWGVDPDPAQNILLQAIPNFGCIAPRSLVALGEADLLFLSYSGVRSLQARDSSNIATVEDIGVPINQTINALVRALSSDPTLPVERDVWAIGAMEPEDNRYWLVIEDVVYVLSYFPGSQISAWSTYTPGFTIDDMTTWGRRLLVLSDNVIYTYGALDPVNESEYDSTKVEVEIPYLDARKPATHKQFTAVDLAADGRWDVYMGFDPNRPELEELVGRLSGSTYHMPDAEAFGESTHVKLRFVNETDGYAKLSNAAVHYEETGT